MKILSIVQDNESDKSFIINNINDFKNDVIKSFNLLNENVNGFNKTKTYTESGLKSIVDKDFINKDKLSLSNFKKELISQSLIKKYSDNYKYLNHIRVGPNTKGYCYIKNNEIICTLMVETKNNGDKWIQALEINSKYQGHGLSKQLLDVATKELGAKFLSVYKYNKLAIYVYEKYGFKTFDSTNYMYFMRLK